MDLCHLKNSELEPKLQKYKGRVVLRGDIVKDDSESYAVFTEQGSSASQMTTAKIMDIISRLPGCSGPSADAVSAYTLVKNGGCTQITDKFQSQNVHIFGNGPVWMIQLFFLSEICTVILRQDYLLWERQFEQVLFKHGWETVPNWECICQPRKRTILVCVCGRCKTRWGRNRTLVQHAKCLGKTLIWESQHNIIP